MTPYSLMYNQEVKVCRKDSLLEVGLKPRCTSEDKEDVMLEVKSLYLTFIKDIDVTHKLRGSTLEKEHFKEHSDRKIFNNVYIPRD